MYLTDVVDGGKNRWQSLRFSKQGGRNSSFLSHPCRSLVRIASFQDNERDALRHYIGTQIISEKFGPALAGIITNLNEYPYDSTNVNKKVDIKNNLKAIKDFSSGNMLNPNWLNMLKFPNEENSATVLDSLLKTLTIPPTDSEY